MFKWGLEGGKPAPGTSGVQPEWFYKGDGTCVVAPEAGLALPSFALDGGDEAEIAGLYVIAPDGTPRRVGYALGNEFSDHVMERQNYLYLAHSKLRQCAYGPELLIGELPEDVLRHGPDPALQRGRLGEAIFLGRGEHVPQPREHWSITTSNTPTSGRPGDVHVHFFGASAISTADGVETRVGDVFEIESDLFGRPLRNSLVADDDSEAPRPHALERVRVRKPIAGPFGDAGLRPIVLRICFLSWVV